MRTRTLLPTLVGLALLGAGCADQQPLAPESALNVSASALTATEVIQGETGPGALYEIHKPANWNGDLLLYAHGFRDPALPITLSDQDNFFALRNDLVARGYAVAYSSYSENGLAFKDAAQRTHQLRGIFTSKVGRPDHVYLAGHSLGGVVTLMLAEQYPAQYSGALTMCGQVAGTQAALDYFAHIRVLFDYFYPNANLPGDAMNIPQVANLNTQVIYPALGAIQANPAGAGAIAAIMAARGTPIPFTSGSELVTSLLNAIGYNYRAGPDLMDRTHGHFPFDNTQTVYTGPGLPATLLAHLNANVDRFSATPDALNYMQKYYEPTGRLRVPVLTLRNGLDPISPSFHEPAYKNKVTQAGRSDLLAQRLSTAPFGHCGFSPSEMLQAFRDLENWAENGAKPTS